MVERVFSNLDFRGLTNLTQPAAGDDRLFVAEQLGRILAFADDPYVDDAQVFLDIRDNVNDSGSEEGLLGLAFDPQFDDNGYFYVYYSASGPRRSVVSRFQLSADGQTADSDSELVILEIEQPYRNHNGGQLAFGPDGFLYIGLGDGGAAGDPMGHGRNTKTLLGSILRIDVSESTPETPYTIPADNPLLDDSDARPEIWAYGLRNPWRFSFDRETGQLWAGDVGQNSLEEVDLVERGGDYGWNTLEGTRCFSPRTSCDSTGTVPPVWEYPTGEEGCSVIGGYVYRGERIPSLRERLRFRRLLLRQDMGNPLRRPGSDRTLAAGRHRPAHRLLRPGPKRRPLRALPGLRHLSPAALALHQASRPLPVLNQAG